MCAATIMQSVIKRTKIRYFEMNCIFGTIYLFQAVYYQKLV